MKKIGKTVNSIAIDAYNEYMKDVNSWNHYGLSYNDCITNIINTLIVDQETAMLHASQGDMYMSVDTFTKVCICDGIDLVNPGC